MLCLTAHSDTECFNLGQTKGPRPKLYQNVILPHINLVNSKSARRQQKTLTLTLPELRSDELYQLSAPKIDLDRGYANRGLRENIQWVTPTHFTLTLAEARQRFNND